MSAETGTPRLPKPQLRGFLVSGFRKHAIAVVIITTVNVCLYKFLVADPRKKKYADFYKNYDAEKEFEIMRQLGLFDGARPDNEK